MSRGQKAKVLEGCKLPQHCDLQFAYFNPTSEFGSVCFVEKLAVHAFVVPNGLLIIKVGQAEVSCAVMVSLFAIVDVVTLDSQVRLSACCMLLTYFSFSRAEILLLKSELCLCPCVLSAAAADYNTTVPKGLYLWSTREHYHPLWGKRETSSKVRRSFCCIFISKLIQLRWLPELEAMDCIHVSISFNIITFKNSTH